MKNRFLLLSVAALCATTAFGKAFNIGVEAGYDFAHYSKTGMEVSETLQDSKSYKVMAVASQHGTVLETYVATTIDGQTTKSNYNSVKTNRLPQMHGFHVGPTFDWRFADSHGLGLRFGLQYQFLTTKGGIFDTKDAREARKSSALSYSTTQHALQIPIRLSYTWSLANDMHVWVMTGPKFNVGLSLTSQAADKNSSAKEIYNYYNGNTTLVDANGNKSTIEGGIGDYIPFDASWGFGVGFGWQNFNISASYDLGFTDMSGYRHFGETVIGSTKYYDASLTQNNQLQVTLSYTFPVLKKK